MNPLLTDQLVPLALAVGAALCLDVAYWRWKKKQAQTQNPAGFTDWLAAWSEVGGSRLDKLWASLTSGWRATLGRFRAQPATITGEPVSTVQGAAAIAPEPAPETGGVPASSGPVTVSFGPPTTLKELPVKVPAESQVEPKPQEGSVQINTVTVPVTGGDGASRLRVTLDIPIGVTVTLSIEAHPTEPRLAAQALPSVMPSPMAAPAPLSARPPVPIAAPAAAAQPARWALPRLSLRSALTAAMHGVQSAGQRLVAAMPVRFRTLDVALFSLGLLVYLVTRLVGIDRFPIYFFTDEAVHTVLAANFVRDGFQNSYREFLPTYFSLGSSFGLNSISVYVQVLPYLLFGKSIFVTRATSAFISLLGTAAVALTLRDIFKVRYWWAAVLLLAITPTWFMHSRTAFEYAEVAAFYGGFIYCYLRYRCGSPRWLYAAVAMGALVFYTHGLGEVLIGATAAILFVIDLPYHFKNRAVLGRGLVLALLLALPFLRYWLAHNGEFTAQLHQRGSYWTTVGLSLGKKLSNFASEYSYGLSPLYWYFPETRDLARHIMNGYGNIWWPTLPFAVLGLVQIVRKFRQPAYRVLLVTLLTTPIASALVAIGVLRMLWFLMPITVITGLGLSAVLEWLEQRRWPTAVRSPATALAATLFVVLTGFSFYMLYDALTNGPLWVKDYTLYGEQYGAKQIFADAIPAYLKRDSKVRFEVSPTWANGTDLFIPFFLSPDQQARVQLRNIDYYLSDKQTIDPNAIQVMTPEEYERASASGKFNTIQLEQILPYPDGRPGFYFTRLTYADNVDQVFAAEREARRQLAVGQFTLGGQDVTVRYSQIGSNSLGDIFDGNWDSLVRGLEANPFVLEFSFPQPRPITGIAADFGSMDLTMNVLLYVPGSDTPVKLSQTWRNQPPDPHVEMKFDNAPGQVSKMRVTILNLLAGDTANIHIREFKILP